MIIGKTNFSKNELNNPAYIKDFKNEMVKQARILVGLFFNSNNLKYKEDLKRLKILEAYLQEKYEITFSIKSLLTIVLCNCVISNDFKSIELRNPRLTGNKKLCQVINNICYGDSTTPPCRIMSWLLDKIQLMTRATLYIKKWGFL